MEKFHTNAHLDEFYEILKQTYSKYPESALQKIRQKFLLQYSNNSKNIQIKTDYYTQLYKLKVLLETRFMRDIKCNYKFILSTTPSNVGCDIRELIFNQEKDVYRENLLTNIAAASRFLTQNNSKNKIPHILTDIDDTLYPSKSFLIETSGRDSSWKNKMPYPGIRKFYDLFYSTLKIPESRYTTVLTGTPLFLKETKLADETISEILGPNFGFLQGVEKKRDAIQILLSGMKDRPFYHFAPSAVRVGTEKFRKFRQYSKIFPEYRFFFIGDNGQGDLLAGKMMIAESPDTLVFIHNIIYDGKFLFSKDDESTHLTDGRLFFFKNYLELGYIFTNILNIFTKAQYAEFKMSVIEDIQNGLPNISKVDKILYEHYNIKTEELLKRKTLNKRFNRCKTRKLPYLPKSPTLGPL